MVMEVLQSKDHWKNRRHMAWCSAFAGLLFPVIAIFTESNQLVGIAAPFYLFCGANIGFYMGGVVVDDRNKAKYLSEKEVD
jgi:hypothetical protein